MGVKIKMKFDAKRVNKILDEYEQKVLERMEEVGKKAVKFAEQNGEYHNVTGRLRRSNHYEIHNGGLRLYNDAPYALDVQSRGLDVINGAALFAVHELMKK